MSKQIKVLVILLVAVTFSAFAGQPTLTNDSIVAVYKGFSEDKGYTFEVAEGSGVKELSFKQLDDAILGEYNLQDESLVGANFEITYEDQDTDLRLKTLKKVE